MDVVDLRSDTVTRPTPAMRTAMALAEVGDDVMGEDPTVNRLEAVSAVRMGKEAGLFVPSGTMGNLIAILAHCNRGDEVIMGNKAHTFLKEAGGVAAVGGVHPFTLQNQPDGTICLEEIRRAIRTDDLHHPVTRLIVLENTHNRCGGAALGVDYTRKVAELAGENGLKVHLDGARIFNAAVAHGVAACELTAPVDTVTFCLSKGLCAPVGSVLCGPAEFIGRARRIRKQLGGGMRQAGILAAAGIVALEHMVDRLVEDHRRARKLAEGLAGIPGIHPDTLAPPTNMVYATLEDEVPLDGVEVIRQMNALGVAVDLDGERRFRMVTHYWVDDEGIDCVLQVFRQILV
ncbi:MAG TPA: low-specificity L-threonine aldolase [Levilinea sp.]|nr:low-specificity L-threonine aldolase [Levilinea sp.]